MESKSLSCSFVETKDRMIFVKKEKKKKTEENDKFMEIQRKY